MNKCLACGENNIVSLYKIKLYKIVRCNHCGFQFVKNRPTEKTLSKFYKQFDYKDLDLAETIIRKDAKHSLNLLNKYKKNDQSFLLDLGCGRGYFIDEARKMGWDVKGIDYSQQEIKFARNVLNLNVSQANIMKYRSNNLADAIVINQVIEHLKKPEIIINNSNKLLNRNGLLYISTPNIDSLMSLLKKQNYDYLIPPEHLNFFNAKSLITLLKQNNFKILYFGTWSYSSEFAGIIKHLLRKNIDQEKKYLGRSEIFNTNEKSFFKQIKIILFDNIFSELFHNILNIYKYGSILEIVAIKK